MNLGRLRQRLLWPVYQLQGSPRYRHLGRGIARRLPIRCTLAGPADLPDVVHAIYHGHAEAMTRQHRAADGTLNDYHYLLARLWGRVIGTATLCRRQDAASQEQFPGWWLFDLRVALWLRGFGVGETLVRQAVVEAAALGADRLSLLVVADNRPALALYHKLGFAPMSLPALEAILAKQVDRGAPRQCILSRPLP